MIEIIYEDSDLIVINKPAGIPVFTKNKKEKAIIDYLVEDFPRLKKLKEIQRYGIVHRLDKETSGILLIAKNKKTLDFLQNQFKEKRVSKEYIALVFGKIEEKSGKIETLIGRSPKKRLKQKVFLEFEPNTKGKRKAITYFKVLKRFKNYTLLKVFPKTGRKHQIRVHFYYFKHPIVGDKLYRFKNQKDPDNLKRQFLHADYLKIKLPSDKEKEFKAKLPEDLKKVLNKLSKNNGF